ncbi:MAG: DUF481 domain-containing protein [Bryobacteraceae bacterium]|jgi:hypothetical protein
MRPLSLALIGVALAGFAALAQTPPKPDPDTLILADGEKLIGHLVRSTGAAVRFKSDVLGEVSVDWSKVKELHSAQKFAVLTKSAVAAQEKARGKRVPLADVPEGNISVADAKIDVATTAGAKTIPIADTADVLDVQTYEKAFTSHPGFFSDWNGAVTAGGSVVEATQTSETFNESISLVRALPAEDWLARRNRTAFDFSSSWGEQTQPGTPSIKTSIYHADAERDEYVSTAMFGFGQAQFDHNYSQGLDLQQTYVGGIGWSVFKRDNEGLDLKGGMSYIQQEFAGMTKTQNLASSVFDEKYMRKVFKGAIFTQEFSVSPTWSNSKALSALGNARLTLPVYKRLAVTIGVIDTFLNDPPPAFKRNSLQATAGLTYSLR